MSSSIPYSACSSFAALSGNSDLKLHSSSGTAASYPESDERDTEVAKENVTVQLDEENEEEEPIDHLLEVKKVYPVPIKIKKKKFSITFDVISLVACILFFRYFSILVKACGKCLHFIWWKFSIKPKRSNTGIAFIRDWLNLLTDTFDSEKVACLI